MSLNSTLLYGLLLSILMVIAPHAEHLPTWLIIESIILLGWRGYLTWSGNKLPPRWLLFFITAASTGGLLVSYHTLFGRDAGVALLILLTTLKFMELREKRDATIMLYLSCFIIITNFFYSQSIPVAIFMLLTLLVILATWIQMYSNRLPLKSRLRFSSVLLLQAIPLSLLLFVLFPRIQGPLWGMPQDAFAQSGLTDTMSPGSMSKLSLSEAVAFRVTFEGTPPLHSMMYWRGPVLWDFDGTTWRAGATSRGQIAQVQENATTIDYTVTLEPHNKHWLFALDTPISTSIPSFRNEDFQILTRRPVTARIRYNAKSQFNYLANVEEAPFLLKRALLLPGSGNPRARELGKEWRNQYADDASIINTALQLFNRQGYEYTLEPPLLGENTVDEFLFDTRKGFCEHYASAFVFLMRAAGIPARVVTGYQGGEYNSLGDYTIIRQSDAHAWAEVWLKGQGWKRYDPTAAISPERVNNGLSAAMPGSAALPFVSRYRTPWLLKFRFNIDLLNHQWNQWVLGYNSERQFAFLTRLGMEDVTWQKMAINLLLGMGVLVGLFALIILRKLYRHTRDPAQTLYLKFCAKLARTGILRAEHEGPQDFAIRAAKEAPQQAEAIHDITRRYLALRYENHPGPDVLQGLRHAIRAFKI